MRKFRPVPESITLQDLLNSARLRTEKKITPLFDCNFTVKQSSSLTTGHPFHAKGLLRLLHGKLRTLRVRCTISKTRASVSSGYPNTEKQMKAQGRRPSAFIIVSRCLDTPMKHEARVLEITSHDHSQTNHKQRLPIRFVCYLTFLPG